MGRMDVAFYKKRKRGMISSGRWVWLMLAGAVCLSACQGRERVAEEPSAAASIPAVETAGMEAVPVLRPSGYPPEDEVAEVFLGEMKFEIPLEWYNTNPGGDRVFLYPDEKGGNPLACVAMGDPAGQEPDGEVKALSMEEGQALTNQYGLEEGTESPIQLNRWDGPEEGDGFQSYSFAGIRDGSHVEGRMERVSVEGKPFLIFLFDWDGQDALEKYGPEMEAVRRTLRPSGLSCLDTGLCG